MQTKICIYVMYVVQHIVVPYISLLIVSCSLEQSSDKMCLLVTDYIHSWCYKAKRLMPIKVLLLDTKIAKI